MSVLHLSEEEVRSLVDMPAAVAAVREAFKQLSDGRAMNVPRVRATGPHFVLHTLSATAEYLGLAGWKAYSTTRSGARFLVGLYAMDSGELLALIDADYLGQLRTGAVSAVAAETLAVPDATECGIFGSGGQARTQLEAMAVARPLRRVVVYSRSPERRARFAHEMSRALAIEVVPVQQPQDAAQHLPIVITATTSVEPVLQGKWLSPGTLVCAMGSNWPHRAEVDPATLRRADAVVCDRIDACQHEAGDLILAAEDGAFEWLRAIELADVVAGKAMGRPKPESIVVFKSVGLAIEDVALGAEILKRARAAGVGRELPM